MDGRGMAEREALERGGEHPECAPVRSRILAAAASGAAIEDGPRVRRHLAECAECTEAHREALLVAAHIGRERRLAREAAERAARTRERLRLARGARLRPTSGLMLRTLLVPAVLILLFSRQVPSEVSARASALTGTYSLGERRLDSRTAPQSLRRGDWIVTDGISSVELSRGQLGHVFVTPGSRVCVEDPKLSRVLFGAGSVEFAGPCTITTAQGVVELREGAAWLHSSEGGVRVELGLGRATLIDAHGARELAPGERGWLGVPPANATRPGL